MEYGITIPRTEIAEQPDPLKYLTDFARAADQMGCAYCVVGDRLESGMDAFNVLTAIAEASGRMRLVTSVLVLPPRGILVSAKQYAALDVLTGGRVIAGVGTGSMFRDYEVVGMEHEEMWPRFEEGVKALRAYLTPDAPPFKGTFYDTTGVNLEPKPVQKPSLPIWIGSWGSKAGLRRVARLADGWLSSAGPGHQSPEQFAADVTRLNAFLVEEGKDPEAFPIAISTMALFLSEDAEERGRIGGPGYVPRPEGIGVAQRPHDPWRTPMRTTWSALAPHVWTKCDGGRRRGLAPSIWRRVVPTHLGRCACLWMRWRARFNLRSTPILSALALRATRLASTYFAENAP